jgi:murein DD-endopeptidase MepM/ murein hydrolase activator NlpD
MGCVAEPRRSLRLFRLALFATISAAAAGCSSDTDRFESNPFGGRQQASAQHPQDVTGTVQQQRSSSVHSQPLPPPTASAPGTRPVAGGSSGGSPGMASYHPKNASPEITGSAHSTKSGWSWQGGTAITVQQGDTIDSITRRYGVPASAIAEANNLPNGSTLRPGQRLVIPKYEVTGSTVAPRPASPPAPRPMISAPAVTAPAATGPHVHIIAPGETLMKLSRQYNKPLVEIARANNIPPSTLVKIGDRIVIPGLRGQQQAKMQPQAKPAPMAQAQPQQIAQAQPKPAVAPAAPQLVAQQPKPTAPATQKVASAPMAAASPPTAVNVVSPAAQSPEPPKAKQEVTAAMPSFRWPVNGRVIQGFGPKTGGQQNDGLNISVPEGTAIKAADDGVVAYAGNELKTYGNLVLIRHSNGYVTAYAHASEIAVKRDDVVKRGQVIAKSGQTGSVTAPQVHFEIRKGSTPVDPAPFLAKSGG